MTELNLPRPTLEARDLRPNLRRSRTNRMVAGVAGGIGEHLDIAPLAVRVAFIVLGLAGGFGVVVYLLLWLLAPAGEPNRGVAASARELPRPEVRQVLGVGFLVLGVFTLLWVSGFWFGEGLAWPVTLAAIGFAVLWARSSADDGRGRLELPSFGSPFEALVRARVSWTRLVLGVSLIGGGMAVFLAATTSLEAAANVVLAVIVTAGGLVLLAGPWLWRLANELMEERSSRIRSQARAEMAAHLHDSVLQTLALIQRAKEPREMASLARTQERDLRAWLYGRAPSVHGARLRDAIDAMAGRSERLQQVKVEAVVVGDADLDDDLRALVSAASEAVLNAAKHSGVSDVSVYVEVDDGQVDAFVRDNGTGFDPRLVPDDRRGIADSIVKRMERHGGTTSIRSRPGAGTEVVLHLPRRPELPRRSA
ncbi:MAG TPA: PspC domain-containing protein [Candidatus Limnocylindrales bacterium]|nr:PspC domain-containing protein [Candidatus Limnocylindrales bacterium]